MSRRADGEGAVRALLYIPIIHTQADLGNLSEAARRVKVQRLGRQLWQRNLQLVDRRWSEIEQTVEALPLSFDQVRLYQDGLPVCGRELEIVAELAAAGSRNYRLLVRLLERGAVLMGTESSELLVEEYQLMKESLAPKQTAALNARRKELGDSLLKRRDQFIAARINETLQPGETGILLLGLLHSVAEWLAPDLQVSYPVHQLLNPTRTRR